MAADPYQLYAVIAQIAAAFAGFGSIASGLGRLRSGGVAKVDAQRLTTMLFASLCATLLALLPGTFASLALGERWALGASGIVGLIAISVYAPIAAVRARKIWHLAAFSKVAVVANWSCAVIAFGAFFLCAAGLPADRLAGVFLLGLVAMLCLSIVTFSRVIASMLHAHTGT